MKNPLATLSWVEIIVLTIIAPLALFPTPARFLALLTIPAVWFSRALVTRRLSDSGINRQSLGSPQPSAMGERSSAHFFLRTPLDGAVLLLAIMILVSLYATYDISVSLPKIAGLVFGIGVFYAAVAAMSNGRRLAWGVGVYLSMGCALAVMALIGTK